MEVLPGQVAFAICIGNAPDFFELWKGHFGLDEKWYGQLACDLTFRTPCCEAKQTIEVFQFHFVLGGILHFAQRGALAWLLHFHERGAVKARKVRDLLRCIQLRQIDSAGCCIVMWRTMPKEAFCQDLCKKHKSVYFVFICCRTQIDGRKCECFVLSVSLVKT